MKIEKDKIVEFNLVFLIVVIAFLIRCIPFDKVIQPNEINFFSQDPYYHLRRIMLAVKNLLYIPTYDSYAGFPEGLYCFWSPLFDQTIAFLALLAGKGTPTVRLTEIVAAFFPAILGAITIIPFYLLAKELFNKNLGYLSALIFGLLPGHIYPSLLGYTDHHCAEPIFAIMLFYFLLKVQKTQIKEKRNFFAVCAGISQAFSILVWTGSLIFLSVSAIYILGLILGSIKDKQRLKVIFKLARYLFASSFLVLLPICATTYWGRRFLFTYDALSWFQISVIFLTLMFFLFLESLLLNTEKGKKYRFFISLIPAGLVMLASLLFFSTFLSNFVEGINWVIKKEKWYQSITEFQPLFISLGVISFFRPTSYFSFGFYLLPLVFAKIFWNEKKNRLFLIILVIIIAGLGLWQSRFSNFLSVIVAIGLAYLFFCVFEQLSLIVKLKIIPLIVSSILFLWLFSPCLREINSLSNKYPVIPEEWKEILIWLRENTPKTSYYFEPFRQPEYGILAPWTPGHWIVYLSQRPVLANGFHTNLENNKIMMRFYLTEDPVEASVILKEKKIRYIILTDITPNILDFANIIGKDGRLYIYKEIMRRPDGGISIAYYPTARFYKLISTQLYLNNKIEFNNVSYCSSSSFSRLVGNYRLVYESKSKWYVDGKLVSCIKVFEFTPL